MERGGSEGGGVRELLDFTGYISCIKNKETGWGSYSPSPHLQSIPTPLFLCIRTTPPPSPPEHNPSFLIISLYPAFTPFISIVLSNILYLLSPSPSPIPMSPISFILLLLPPLYSSIPLSSLYPHESSLKAKLTYYSQIILHTSANQNIQHWNLKQGTQKEEGKHFSECRCPENVKKNIKILNKMQIKMVYMSFNFVELQ